MSCRQYHSIRALRIALILFIQDVKDNRARKQSQTYTNLIYAYIPYHRTGKTVPLSVLKLEV